VFSSTGGLNSSLALGDRALQNPLLRGDEFAELLVDC
jgi:hypothetical protein